jgi:protein MpaA
MAAALVAASGLPPALVACSSDPPTTAGAAAASGPVVVTVPGTGPAVTLPAGPTPSTAGTAPPSGAAPTASSTVPSAPTTTVPDLLQQAEIGRSVEGRPIVALERGRPGGIVVLVIGVIHGDEAAGAAVVDQLETMPLPDGVDLWLVPSANPDGQAAGTRTNAHQVDLNRNFPARWAPLGQPGDEEYAGTGPASEPETQALVNLIELIRPDLALWYHQDLFRIAPGRGRQGRVRKQYADLTGLPLAAVTGGTYTGTAVTWEQRTVPRGVAFIVELGKDLSELDAARHARAVLEVATS